MFGILILGRKGVLPKYGRYIVKSHKRSFATGRVVLSELKTMADSLVDSVPRPRLFRYDPTLQSILQEHQHMVRQGNTTRSRIDEHVITEQHKMLWDQAEITLKELWPTRRKLKEATAMALTDNLLSQPSLHKTTITIEQKLAPSSV